MIPNPTTTAITRIHDLTAMGVLHAAHEAEAAIGRSLAVAGFDGITDSAHTQPHQFLEPISPEHHTAQKRLDNTEMLQLRLLPTIKQDTG